MRQQLIIEFLGTFFLVLMIALTGNPLAIGLALTALVYMGGYISGAHYNPAVTLAVYSLGKMKSGLALRYITTQLVAGLTASLVYNIITTNYFLPAPGSQVSFSSAFIIETLCTFLLVFVILNVAVNPKVKDNHYYGLAIGMTLVAIAYAGGSISGGAYNPAVGIGPMMLKITDLQIPNLILYIAGPALGGWLAAKVYQVVSKN